MSIALEPRVEKLSTLRSLLEEAERFGGALVDVGYDYAPLPFRPSEGAGYTGLMFGFGEDEEAADAFFDWAGPRYSAPGPPCVIKIRRPVPCGW